MQVARTLRLILRQLTPADASFMLVLLNSQGFIENIGDRGVRTLVQANDYILNGPMKVMPSVVLAFTPSCSRREWIHYWHLRFNQAADAW